MPIFSTRVASSFGFADIIFTGSWSTAEAIFGRRCIRVFLSVVFCIIFSLLFKCNLNSDIVFPMYIYSYSVIFLYSDVIVVTTIKCSSVLCSDVCFSQSNPGFPLLGSLGHFIWYHSFGLQSSRTRHVRTK